MSKTDTAEIGVLRWLLAGVAAVLTIVTIALIGRALFGQGEPRSAPRPAAPAAIEETGQPSGTPTAAPAVASQTPTEATPPDVQPVEAPTLQQSPPPGKAPGRSLTAASGSAIVDQLLRAVHDGDVAAGEELITDEFVSAMGGAEWLGSGPDALKSWKITASIAEDGFVWVSVTETWDYGKQKARYMVIDLDGRIRVDAAEWGL